LATSINADNGAVSGSAGLKSSADSSGVLALQTNGTTAISIDASQAVTMAGRTSNPTTISVGAATPSTSGAGITFPATQSASTDANTLDDYEEGTWTPTITPGSGSLTAYTSSGSYTKIGRSVYLQFGFTITTAGTASGIATTSLPFTPYNQGTGPVGQNMGVVRECQATGNVFFLTLNNAGTTAAIQTIANAGITWSNGYGYACSIVYQTS
jgi:hypothetical protein